jgi:hypothetical protein
MWKRKERKKKKMTKNFRRIFLIAMVIMIAVMLTGCRKPYDKPEFITIEASQTAFLIPLIGDIAQQGAFESEELLLEAKVATKEIQIPHRWVQTGRYHWMGEWKPSATVIIVERKPVSRSWESGNSSADSANRAVFGETSDNIGIYVGMNCTAMIEEKDAAKFLYRYNNTPLETIIDTDIKKLVEDRFNTETAKYTSTELGAVKGTIMEDVKTYVVEYFKEYGITITVLGLKEGISFENPEIQKALDAKFASEQDLEIQENKNLASIALAEAEAQAIILKAEAQAEANRLLSESITSEILAQQYYDKWNGTLPHYYGASETLIQVPNIE